MGVPQAMSLAVGALLVTLVSYHLIFGVMALVTALGAVYLVLVLGRQAFRPPAAVEGAAAPQAVPPPAEPAPAS